MPYGGMALVTDELEISIYPREASYNCRLWEWTIWRRSELLAEDTFSGSLSGATRAAEGERHRILMRERRNG